MVAMGTQKETAVFYCSGNGEVGEGFIDMALFFFFSPERSGKGWEEQVILGRRNSVHQSTMKGVLENIIVFWCVWLPG